MIFLLKYFIKRLPREGFKSLSVPALALTLVFLINVLGGIKTGMEAEYKRVIATHPISVVVSDGDGTMTDDLEIGFTYVNQFTDPGALWPLEGMVKDVRMKRTLDVMKGEQSYAAAEMYGVNEMWLLDQLFIRKYENSEYDENDKWFLDSERIDEKKYLERYEPHPERIYIEYFEGFGHDIFSGVYGDICVVSESLLGSVAEAPESDYGFLLHYSILERRGLNFRTHDFVSDVVGVIRNLDKNLIVASNYVFHNIRQSKNLYAASEHYFFNSEKGTDSSYVEYFAVNLQSAQKPDGELIGITYEAATELLSPDSGNKITYFGAHNGNLFLSDENLCVVSEDLLEQSEDGFISLFAASRMSLSEIVETRFEIAGVATGGLERTVFAPFKTVSGIASESDGRNPHTELLRATLRDNERLIEFKDAASRTFSRVGVFFNVQRHALTIFDNDFYDITESLMQTIFFIEITTPFVYALSVCVGFVASFLLTRRRKAEFANMRSVGVNKLHIFTGALFEQSALCAVGAAAGCVLYALTWGDVLIGQSAIFVGCYTLGAAFSALKAAGADVLKILREKE